MGPETIEALRDRLLGAADALRWLPGLLSRAVIGGVFIQSGWGKLTHLDKVAGFFASIGIPAPRLQAPFVAAVEFGCGALVLLGLFTRPASLPLVGTMVVAIATVKIKDVHDYSDFLSLSEFLFIVLLAWLAIEGAGALSLDSWLEKRSGGSPTSKYRESHP